MKNLDKINETYHGRMGDEFSRHTKNRIDWVCSQATGNLVLDIGCSQGIVEEILSREGKKIVGIDIEEEAIDYAKKSFAEADENYEENVTFLVSSIFDYESDQLFDCIILSEVMEHFSNSEALLRKARSLLAPEGRIIICVPFGIYDYFDHKKTYYCFNLLSEIEPFFQVDDVHFVERWVGVVAHKTDAPVKSVLDAAMMQRLEQHVFVNERKQKDTIRDLTRENRRLTNSLKEAQSKQAMVLAKLDSEEKFLVDYKRLMEQYKALEKVHNEFLQSRFGRIAQWWWAPRGKSKKKS
jgi:2-polyprenyl-3-methyl-5-hydroxy-6-metoxy-1,4-benzoquinol methylase